MMVDFISLIFTLWDALGRSGMLPVNRWTDRLLAFELCPTGYSGCHKYVPFARFANRRKCNV